MAGLAIRADDEPAEWRRLARRTINRAQALRLVALAAALDGARRVQAATSGAMDRQTLRDGVIRFNQAGPQGLMDRPKGHAPCRLAEGQLALLKAWMLRGPNPEIDGVSAWPIVDAISLCKERFASAWLSAAGHPKRGEDVALVLASVSAGAMSVVLKPFGESLGSGVHAVLALDQAGMAPRR